MPNYSKGDVLLVRYPFTDLSGVKVRPAVVVHAPHPSQDSLIIPLTSRLTSLLPGEFLLKDWEKAGLNVPTAVKRGIYTIHPSLIARIVGRLSAQDAQSLEKSLRTWLGL
jgi:mRNA interferase MazF